MSDLFLSCGRRGWTKAARLGSLAFCLLIAVFGAFVPSAIGASTGMVNLGDASSYAALSGASVGNTVSAGGAPHTTLRGDLGVKANTSPTGFPPGIVTGTVNIGNAAAALAHADLVTAYQNVAARTGGAALAGALAGATITPGLYAVAGAVSNTGTVTLDAGGDPSAVFVFQVNGAMAMAAGSHVVLTGGAQASRVFWQVNGAGAIGANAGFAGTLMALDAVAVGNGTVVNGRAFARNGALTLDANEVYSAPPVVTITGGLAAVTTDTTPAIGGTTDVEAPAVVTVTVNGQTLTATPSGGAWSVTSAMLANATYPIVASVTDGAGNLGRATQQLTVDTVPPVVTLSGSPSETTNDPTPTISGTSDVAPGTTVRVAVDAQTLIAVVQTAGTWNVTPDALPDGAHTVTASVTDPAGNPGTDTQALTVDTTPPAVTIAGGPDALTDDATPSISGTADVAPGTAMTAVLGNQTLSGVVQADGTWSVTAAALADGPHRITMNVSDAAGNPASVVQMLMVDTVSPIVAITGGASATTDETDPTITGTSDAAPGTIVTVSVAGQTMTTLLQPNGTWNVTSALVGLGTWTVVASAPDPAGNMGSATQVLTIAIDALPGPGSPAPTAGAGPPSLVTPVPPATTPGPTPAGGGTVTTVAKATVAHDVSQKLHGPLLSIGTKVTAPAGGGLTVTVSGTIRIKGIKKAIKLTTATTKLAAGHSATLKVKPKGTTKAAKAALTRVKAAARAGTRVTATITIKMIDAAGHAREVQRTVKLIR